jgi:predicted PurR-regulated permease PerM
VAPPAASRRFLLALVLAAIALFLYVASPFAKPLLVAATLAAVLAPAHARLSAALRGRTAASAALLAVGVLLALVGPLAWVVSVLVGEVVGAARWLRETLASQDVAGLVARLPAPLQDLAARLNADVPRLVEWIRDAIASGGGAAALGGVGGVLSATGGIVAKTLVALVALYFVLAEGRRLMTWVEEVTPLGPGQVQELVRTFHDAVVAVVASTFATAAVQAALAFLGYLVAGIPQPLFFGFLTFLAALVPLVGAVIVTVPVAVLVFATGSHVAGVALAVWAIFPVSTVDNFLKPLLLRRGLSVHVSLVFLALLGGLVTFGAIGFLVGPLALAFFLAMVRIWRREEAGRSGAARSEGAAAAESTAEDEAEPAPRSAQDG